MTNYKVELFSFHRMSEKKNLSIERKLTNQTVIAMFIFCLPTIHNAIGQYPPCSPCQLELETNLCEPLCGPSFPALFSTVLMSPERGCEAPQLVVAAGPDGGHGRRGGEQGQVPHHPADRQCGYY